jgi:hypothetical protein
MKPTSTHTLILAAITVVLIAPAAAQTQTETTPGLIGPGSALHQFDVSLDTTLIQWGVKPPGDVAAERASEAMIATEQNLTEARSRALNGLDEAVRRANGVDDKTGLNKAQALLEDLQATTPDEANKGLQTALDNIIEAQNRSSFDPIPAPTGPDQTPAGTGAGGGQ